MLLTLVLSTVLAGCAAPDPLRYPPQPDMQEVARLLNCPIGRTATCVQRIKGPYQCYCADEDALRMVLEPDKF